VNPGSAIDESSNLSCIVCQLLHYKLLFIFYIVILFCFTKGLKLGTSFVIK